MAKRRWKIWLLVLGAWVLFGLVEVAFEIFRETGLTPMLTRFNQGGERQPAPWWRLVFWNSVGEVLWAALTPLIVAGARRFRIERRNWPRRVLLHAPIAFAVAVAHLAAFVALYWGLHGHHSELFSSPFELFKYYFYRFLSFNLFIYCVILSLVHALDYYRQYQAERARASELRAQLAQAQLQALKMQLHPHFLFNTLNTIAELIYHDPEAAERMVTQLSDLLRISLDKVGVQEVPLKQELEFLGKYLEIEQTRFQERLRVDVNVTPETLDARVPNMILQPLVENAVRYAVAPRAAGGRIEIRARRENGSLRLDVSDDGRGLPEGALAPPSGAGGVGLSNTRARLERLYGAAHRFELSSSPEAGLSVRMTIPFREGGAEGAKREDQSPDR